MTCAVEHSVGSNLCRGFRADVCHFLVLAMPLRTVASVGEASLRGTAVGSCMRDECREVSHLPGHHDLRVFRGPIPPGNAFCAPQGYRNLVHGRPLRKQT